MGDLHDEEEAGRLSFSNLALGENNSGSLQHTPRSTDQFFEFFTSQTLPIYSSQRVVFCGKIVHVEEEEEEEELNEYRKRDYFANLRSHSFRKSAVTSRKENGDISCRRYSGSTRFSAAASYRVKSVNITALTSMSEKSRRRMFMFGPVKFKPEMELSEIKQRLRREPAAAPGKEVVGRGGKGGGVGGSGRRLWGVVRSNLRLRWHLTRVFTKSLGCLPVGRGGKSWIGVGN